ncbi:MAG: rod shape-determining protein MreC [Gemmatimonadetes bacterium]|nr:rod shape-determining protein MreC [Gemmatimonadota bacterium]
MTFASERTASRRDTLIFVACLLLAIIARSVPRDWGFAVASGFRSTLLVPFLALQNQAELTKTSRKRFAAVVTERDSFALLADSVPALRAENDQLRAVLGLRGRLPVTHVAAEVLHQSLPTNAFMVTLSAGRAQGVRPLAPVLAPNGLFGVVDNVEANTSVAMLWAHPDFRASAMTLDGSVFGIVAPYGSRGPNEMLMELSGIPYREQVPPGTMVYTSGLGDVYPKGIPLGTVLEVGSEGAGWSRTYLVLPIVHPAQVSHVMILLSGSAGDLRPAFPPKAPPQ